VSPTAFSLGPSTPYTLAILMSHSGQGNEAGNSDAQRDTQYCSLFGLFKIPCRGRMRANYCIRRSLGVVGAWNDFSIVCGGSNGQSTARSQLSVCLAGNSDVAAHMPTLRDSVGSYRVTQRSSGFPKSLRLRFRQRFSGQDWALHTQSHHLWS